MNISKTKLEEIFSKISVLIGKSVKGNSFSSSTLEKVFETIKAHPEIKRHTESLRSITDVNERQKYKLDNLPFFTIGNFNDNVRQKQSFLSTQYAIYDYDHLGDSFDETLEKVKQSRNVLAAFRSPSGDGLKVIYKFNNCITDANRYSELYKYYAKQFEVDLGAEADKTSDVSRACFFSYDPDLYLNPDAESLDTELEIPEELKNRNNFDRENHLVRLANGIPSGENRTPTLVQTLGMLNNLGIDRDYAITFSLGWNKGNGTPLTDEKVITTVNDVYDRYAEQSISEKAKNYYSFETKVCEARITGDVFSLRPFGEKKFYVVMDAKTKEEKDKYFSYIVKNKHIHNLKRVDHIADMGVEKSYFEYDEDECVFTAHIAAKPVKVKDNQFVEDYLASAFCEHKEFIKKWLAVFYYTNYKKLPFLILTGKRTVGKNTFAQAISEMFPTLCEITEELDGSFNPEGEKKLLIIDEAVSSGKMQYVKLKQLSGASHIKINEKYVPKYKVRNNLNLIVLSNDDDAITVSRDELPPNEYENQFFVYKMKKFEGKPDPNFEQKLIDRLGYYIRTELKEVFDKIDFEGCRYSIPVPITEEEKLLFQNCISDLEAETDKVIEKLNADMDNPEFKWRKHILRGQFPTIYLSDFRNFKEHKLIGELKRRGFLKNTKADKLKQVDGRRPSGYYLTEKWMKEIKDSLTTHPEPEVDPNKIPLI